MTMYDDALKMATAGGRNM